MTEFYNTNAFADFADKFREGVKKKFDFMNEKSDIIKAKDGDLESERIYMRMLLP